jgi:hypothetical protein
MTEPDTFNASVFLDRALSRILSTFGNLVFLADLRDYTGPIVELPFRKKQIDRALQQKHREIFFIWLGRADGRSGRVPEKAKVTIAMRRSRA